MVKFPATEKSPEPETEAEEAIVIPWKAKVPELEIEAPLLKVIVPPVGEKFLVELTVKVPLTEKLTFDWLEGVSEMVRLLKVKLPVLAIVQPVVARVTVPPEAVKLLETFKVPLMVILLEVVIVPLIVKLLSVVAEVKERAALLPLTTTVDPPALKVPELEKTVVDEPLRVIGFELLALNVPALPILSTPVVKV